jgi:hypothetical protein
MLYLFSQPNVIQNPQLSGHFEGHLGCKAASSDWSFIFFFSTLGLDFKSLWQNNFKQSQFVK